MAVAAVRAGDPIVGAQMGTDADGGRFLADVEVQEAGHLPLFVDVLPTPARSGE